VPNCDFAARACIGLRARLWAGLAGSFIRRARARRTSSTAGSALDVGSADVIGARQNAGNSSNR
jgi:hypothetical protein